MPWTNRSNLSSTARGYGRAHRLARAAAALRHTPADPCVRCGHALGPMGPWLHFDHTEDRSGYLGFSHGGKCPVCGDRCNIKAGGAKGRRVQRGVKPIIVVDRW